MLRLLCGIISWPNVHIYPLPIRRGNGFTDDFPMKASIYQGFSIGYRRVQPVSPPMAVGKLQPLKPAPAPHLILDHPIRATRHGHIQLHDGTVQGAKGLPGPRGLTTGTPWVPPLVCAASMFCQGSLETCPRICAARSKFGRRHFFRGC